MMGKAGADGAGVAYTSPSARTSLGGGDGERRDGDEAGARPLPPRGAPKREVGRTAGAADVAKLGRAMGMLSTAPPARPFGAQTAGVGETKRDGQPEPPAGGETVSEASEGGDADHIDHLSSTVATQDPLVGVPGREAPVEEVKPSYEPGRLSAPAETSQTQPPPPTSSTPDQRWMAGLSEAALPGVDGQEPASSCDSPNAGAAMDGALGDDKDLRDISAAFGSDNGSASSSPRRPPASVSNFSGDPPPPPPAAGRAAAVPEALGLGVAAGPSPFVNTSSPLTRSRNKAGQEASMFGPTDHAVDGDSAPADSSRGKGGSGGGGGAADLFATEAPARAADELFSSEPGAPADTARSPGGPGGGGNDTSMFSQGPPPEVPAVPPPSLPNPWGSSPLKQPLPEPKRWPTKGGTGFDRPLTPLAGSEKSSEAGPPQAPGAGAGVGTEAGAIPSAFFGPASGESGDDDGGFGAVGADGGGRLGGQAFDKPPVAGPLAGIAPAKPWESASGGGGGVPGNVSTVNPSAPTASSTLSSSRFGATGGFKGFSGRSEASGGAWAGSSALAAAAMAAAAAPVTADYAAREPGVTPAGVIASFGFGGKLVTMHPRRKIKLAPAPGVPPTPDDGPTLRKGPVNVSPTRRW